MTNPIPRTLSEEIKTSETWKDRIDVVAKQMDKLALRGKLTAESKLAQLRGYQQEASKRLSGAKAEAEDGLGSIRAHLAQVWAKCDETYQALQEELRGAREDAQEPSTSASSGDTRKSG